MTYVVHLQVIRELAAQCNVFLAANLRLKKDIVAYIKERYPQEEDDGAIVEDTVRARALADTVSHVVVHVERVPQLGAWTVAVIRARCVAEGVALPKKTVVKAVLIAFVVDQVKNGGEARAKKSTKAKAPINKATSMSPIVKAKHKAPKEKMDTLQQKATDGTVRLMGYCRAQEVGLL